MRIFDMVDFEPNHVHFLATVTLDKPSFTVRDIHGWLVRLVHSVNMSILGGPYVVPCADPGNEGITGFVLLKESHSSVHIWDKKAAPYLKMDLYSCKMFDVPQVLAVIGELGPRVCHYQVIDRNHDAEEDLINYQIRILEDRTIDFR
jgi:S-adenosylmethionine/arginine decarboxylase-like enzyme